MPRRDAAVLVRSSEVASADEHDGTATTNVVHAPTSETSPPPAPVRAAARTEEDAAVGAPGDDMPSEAISDQPLQSGVAGRAPAVHSPDPPGPAGVPGRPPGEWRPHPTALIVLIIGLVVTAALTVVSQIGYIHNERRLTTLQAGLTGSLLGTAPTESEGQLARVAGLAAESSDPNATFEQAIAALMAPHGSYASATLALVGDSGVQVLDHVGTKPLRPLDSQASTALLERAAATSALVTTRVVGRTSQKLAYLISAPGPNGTYVVSAAQQLPLDEVLHVPATSPVADLNLAIYFGRSVRPSALVASDVGSLPLTGITSTSTIPFGTSVLTLVVSARGSLSGTTSELLPWGILVVGILLTLLVFVLAERLVRRRIGAEHLAADNRALYQQQRGVATTLQHALLPKAMPEVPGVDLAARYIPSAKGVEIGGDWYSVLHTDAGRLVFVVGDVSGHGVDAASVMASLRYAARTLARLGLGPAEILTRADAEIDITADGHFATVLVGSINLATGTMTLASAGHPPALLVRPGESEYCVAPLGPPLGVGGATYRSSTMAFPPGWSLLAYTDGLVERRGRGIDEGLAALAAAALEASEGPRSAGDLVDRVVASLTDGENDDDIAVLCIRR